ncbi:DEAD/DEAH box helicase [Bradyrhizobium sp. AUGA SZCCT0274]|uniref:DEAD/DEAH box helicase n=1 Tax=Bradyrhizobium sp. AUGA SZCCT0274 TaxID=2807670 RepID=UPI001BAB8DBA|nr:DEAD/DEAH box helicase [Bradyrhizobium sp. AUGA SZCCT0274]MBR1240305.1 DEAD/DEAH box helicase [Bradyrhizobium sp. AUGA SZCCT0274]
MTQFDVLNEVKRRTAEAVIAQSGLSHEGLRRHLRELLGGEDSSAGALMQEPVLEGAHPFVTADQAMAALSGSLLHPDLVKALDELGADHEYRFPRSRKPFLHQAEAWRLLADRQPQSVLVTSGTGSGKTECFLFPILSDLAAQAHGQREPLAGVQAIMLYPLNALIESQRERLSAWTKPFSGKLRYCLYNGDLPKEAKESERRRTPEQVIDRTQLRAIPPPLLVTNITMLEYMLVRAEDQPIIDASRGKLKWIVLDEAHSLVGAAAAEIALLLRRVLLAFAVNPDEVRFVATSATIGSGENVRQQLQRFLADVAGIPDSRVHVIEGQRKMPRRPEGQSDGSSEDIRGADPARLYDVLGRDPQIWRLVERLFDGSVPLAAFEEHARKYRVSAADLIFAMSRAAQKTGENEERLAPIRLHAFERAVAGLWSCINPECVASPLDWPFGRILSERGDQCPSCSAPVLEVVSCNECGEAYLEGTEKGPRLSAPLRNPPRDEFAFDSAREDDAAPDGADDNEDEATQQEEPDLVQDRLFAANPTPAARGFWLDRKAEWRVIDGPNEGSISLLCEEHNGPRACPHCQPGGRNGSELIRSLRFGAPFILGNAAPILLEGVEPAKAEAGETLPSGGRRLLSFTDSRQGTARMAAKLQIESERNFLRSFVYHQVQASMQPAPGADQEIAKTKTEIDGLEAALVANRLPVLESMLAEKRRKLVDLTSGTAEGIAWAELVSRLAERVETSEWIKGVWQARDEQVFADASKVAEFLLLREFSRRPRRANSVETMGLARLRNPSIDRLTEAQLPSAFRSRGKTIDDWRSYLDAVLTGFVRANGAISISMQMQHWVSSKAKLTSLVGPDAQTDGDKRLRAWPNGYFRARTRSRPVAMLLHGLGLNLDHAADRSDLDECLHAAWAQVQPSFSLDPERRVLDFSKTYIAPVVDAFYCPVTRRMLDRAPFGLTPYGLEEKAEVHRLAISVAMPQHPAPMLGLINSAEARAVTYKWIETEAKIAGLRSKGAWTNISDRIALFAQYSRSAEHSAQQDSARLRRYEREFKAGRINILNCSTTMEMGVDIGSVSSVMMTNVPPSIANYRQRVGRAGRRGQAVALAFTFCKDRPLDREAFRDPQAFLRRTLAAPKVTLSSRPIVQRHVNAFLLGGFMRDRAGDVLKMQIGAFLGCPADSKEPRPLKGDRPVEAFIEWLESPGTAAAQKESLAVLTRRSILEGDQRLVEDARGAIVELSSGFVAEWEGLVALTKDEGVQEAGKSRMAVELRRMCGEFLLGSLADRGFLPGHGFPTDVVSFMPGKEFKSPEDMAQDGGRQFRAVGPQRSLDLAIRDYAPGSEIVLDGLVHKSAGVTLNWKRPASQENLAEIQSLRYFSCCEECGASDTRRGGGPDYCRVCGTERPASTEFLRPAGFSVDPRVRAHADTEVLSYIPPEDPAVSARDATWRSLPAPELGRYRCSREGLVYYSNRGGPKGFGYAICLHCGRAEADTDNRGLAAPPRALVEHKPLRYRKGQDLCPGNDKPFSVKRNIALGFEITTDVFELQLQYRLGRAGAHALVIALREALAQELGIEADEMGFSVGQSRNTLGALTVSLFLFDRAAGGAGFSVSFEHLMRPVIRRAEQLLDCQTPGCEKACAACVLTTDAPDGKEDLDRTAALEFLRAHLAFPAEVSPDDCFTDSAELSLAPLDEIDRELRRSAHSSFTVFLPDGSIPAAMRDWPLAGQLLQWAMRGHPVRLAIDPAQMKKLSPAEKLSLRDFSLQHNTPLAAAQAPTFGNGAFALGTVDAGSNACYVWASREMEPRFPGSEWGRPLSQPVVRGRVPIALQFTAVDLDTLLPPPDAQLIQIESELDCDLATFGARASKVIVQLLSKCGSWPRAGVVQASYQDSYVSSPLVARLLIDTLGQIFFQSGSKDASLIIETRPPRSNEQRGQPWQIGHDWRDAADQKAVIEQYGKHKGVRVSLLHGEVPHGRYLTISFGDNSRATIVLDQGFGAWVPPRNVAVRYDFGVDTIAQTKRLASVNVVLQRRGIGKTYFVASSV